MHINKKKLVREKYGMIAKVAGMSCCSPKSSCCCEPSATIVDNLGYKSEELANIPEEANLGLGCGNPIAIASIRKGETVLDLGSGAGIDVFLAAIEVGETGHVIGVDMTPEMIKKARENAVKGGFKNVEFREGDIENLPVDNNSIDLIISNCVLNLIPDKKKAFSEIFRVLNRGGRISISDIVLDGDLPESLKNSDDAYCSCISGASNRQDYLKWLADTGLVDIRIQSEKGIGDSFPVLKGIVTSISVTAIKP